MSHNLYMPSYFDHLCLRLAPKPESTICRAERASTGLKYVLPRLVCSITEDISRLRSTLYGCGLLCDCGLHGDGHDYI